MEKEEKQEIVEKEKEEVKEEKKKNKKDRKTIKPLVVCRVLFISVLDKIYFVILCLMFVISTWQNFAGNFGSVSYGYWARVFSELGILIGLTITYLIYNWFYRCAAKTMLSITEKEIYIEKYIPFKRTEKSIPLEKITSVTTINLFWIFRSLIIFQYHQIPTIFFTWNNQELKDKFDELVNKRTEDVENEYNDRNILTFLKPGFLKKFFIGVGCLLVILGIIRFFGYIFSPSKSVPGTYVNGENKIVLEKDGSCDITPIKESTSCNWQLLDDEKTVYVTFEYEYTWFGSKTTSTSNISFDYEKNKLTYNGVEYIK